MKILKCSDETCNTHKGFDSRLIGFDQQRSAPAPDSWTCSWHTDTNTAAADHVTAVRWAKNRPATAASGR